MDTMSDNATTTVVTETATEESRFYLVAVSFLACFLITSGNLLTMAAIAKHAPLQTRSNAFVASLACADLVVGVAVLSFSLWLIPIIRDRFESTIYICVSQLANAFMSIFTSIYSMLLVAIDRWLIITHPFLHQRLIGKKVIIGAILFPWLFGAIFGWSQVFIVNPKREPILCQFSFLYPEVYYRIITPTVYYIAVIGIFFFYFNIIRIARHHGKAIQRQNQVHARNFETVTLAAKINISKVSNKNNGSIFNEQHWKAAKMMMSVFGVFFICWTPRIAMLTFDVAPEGLVNDAFTMLGLLNSGVNFLVYPLHSQDFRYAFKKIILCFRK